MFLDLCRTYESFLSVSIVMHWYTKAHLLYANLFGNKSHSDFPSKYKKQINALEPTLETKFKASWVRLNMQPILTAKSLFYSYESAKYIITCIVLFHSYILILMSVL